jgi:hypothetical protein
MPDEQDGARYTADIMQVEIGANSGHSALPTEIVNNVQAASLKLLMEAISGSNMRKAVAMIPTSKSQHSARPDTSSYLDM